MTFVRVDLTVQTQYFQVYTYIFSLQICAVLAAVTEVIRSQGGKETETEYFAALVSAALKGTFTKT